MIKKIISYFWPKDPKKRIHKFDDFYLVTLDIYKNIIAINSDYPWVKGRDCDVHMRKAKCVVEYMEFCIKYDMKAQKRVLTKNMNEWEFDLHRSFVLTNTIKELIKLHPFSVNVKIQ